MAKFTMELPDDVLKDFKKIYDNSDEIFGGMTRAGAEVVLSNVRSAAPNPKLVEHVALTKTYKTPTDDGINTKVIFKGYIPFSDPNRKYFSRRGGSGREVYHTTKGVPADFVAIMFEYGRSNGNPFPKKPFFRKSFRKAQIEKAMYKAQKELSGGLLDE